MKENILYNKRGELTTKQIVMLIILIISFVIILYFIYLLNFGGTSDKQICKNSVTLRGNSLIAGQAIPLKCKTSYVCVSMNSGCDSPKMSNPDYVQEVGSKEDVYEFLAEEMYDCWWMFGEGEIDYLGSGLFPNFYCSICSQLVFDSSVKKLFPNGEIDKDDFYNNYLTKKIPNKDITYSEYFLSTDNPENYLKAKYKDEKTNEEFQAGTWGKINLDDSYMIIMALKSKAGKGWWGLAVGGIGAVLAGTVVGIIVGPIGWIVLGAIAIGGTVGAGGGAAIVAPVIQSKSGDAYIPPSIIEVNSDEFKSLQCKDVKSLS